ncbi:MAG TPA: dTDP-4-dehydrorhamnose 3,5-epimerase [Terriglobales bacterium]|nr:dTDP-4-dehydrorhamnose 3,5-epimerase [Terriglobales bacterium]
MKVIPTSIPDMILLEPKVFGDERGFFLETYSEKALAAAGIPQRFIQDNQSYSRQNVLRGLHYQIQHPQGKFIRVVAGEIFDVGVDLRKNSPTFGKWHGALLSAENKHMLWIPPGFAHGFSVLSDGAHVLYKVTDVYSPENERTILWSDPVLKIDWKIKGEPIISAKDATGQLFSAAPVFE